MVERVGQAVTVRATLWPKGQTPSADVVEVTDGNARGGPVTSLLVEARGSGGPTFKTLVHGYGAACAEEVELWERPGLILVGVGQAVTVLDSTTGEVKLRVPMGGYFNSLWLAEDGRDAFVCGDEQVVRLVPPGTVSWQRTLGVDGVMVHRAVGATVFVSAQRRVGGPWVDFLLDRLNGSIVEAPEPEDEPEAAVSRPASLGRDKARGPPGTTSDTRASQKPVQKGRKEAPGPPVDDEDEDTDVRMVRDDETEPDDE
jgi:hypothetical protein